MSEGVTAAAREQIQSFAETFRRTRHGLYAQALAIVADAATAEDLVQEAFARVWHRRGRLKDLQRLDGYLYAAVRNLALDHARRTEHAEGGKVLAARPGAVEEEPGPDPERIDAALRRLLPEQREVIVLRVHLGLSFAEVASRTGAPPGTVHSRYRLAMAHLRQYLGDLAPVAGEVRHV